jgi:hypothetical protein
LNAKRSSLGVAAAGIGPANRIAVAWKMVPSQKEETDYMRPPICTKGSSCSSDMASAIASLGLVTGTRYSYLADQAELSLNFNLKNTVGFPGDRLVSAQARADAELPLVS